MEKHFKVVVTALDKATRAGAFTLEDTQAIGQSLGALDAFLKQQESAKNQEILPVQSGE